MLWGFVEGITYFFPSLSMGRTSVLSDVKPSLFRANTDVTSDVSSITALFSTTASFTRTFWDILTIFSEFEFIDTVWSISDFNDFINEPDVVIFTSVLLSEAMYICARRGRGLVSVGSSIFFIKSTRKLFPLLPVHVVPFPKKPK